MDTLKPNVDVIIRAAEGLMDSETLKAFLRFVLHAGNFINAVSVHARVHTHRHARVHAKLLAVAVCSLESFVRSREKICRRRNQDGCYKFSRSVKLSVA